jgi:hypothetical protein
MKKYALCLVMLALLLAACQSAQPTPAPTAAPTAVPTAEVKPTAAQAPVLELVGPGGTKSLTMDDLKKLPAVEGWGGFKSSTGKITIPEMHKGVALEELCKLVGGLDAKTGISVVAKDGYAMTISYDQITLGDFVTYDPSTGDEIKVDEPLQIIIAYERNGQPMPEDTDGALRMMVVSSKNNQVVDGHWTVKWVNKIELKSLAEDWTIKLLGVINEELDRGSFESCSAPACHGAEWKDDSAQTWTGVPLWLMAARVDDETKHGDGAFNTELADKGYQVEVMAADGYKVTFDIARLRDNKNILLAYLVNGNPLDEKYFPLRLVGSDLKKNEMVGQVAQVHILPPESKPTATPAPSPTPQAAGPAGNAALTINGAVGQELSLAMDDLQAMEVVKLTAEHPKKGPQDYEGVRLSALLDKAQVKADAKTLVFTSSDGYQVEAALADVLKCADCLLAFDAGKLNAVMPGMQSNFWAKDVVRIEVK